MRSRGLGPMVYTTRPIAPAPEMPLEMGSAANLGSCVKYYRHVAYSEGVSLHEHVAVGTATSLLWEESPTSLEVITEVSVILPDL